MVMSDRSGKKSFEIILLPKGDSISTMLIANVWNVAKYCIKLPYIYSRSFGFINFFEIPMYRLLFTVTAHISRNTEHRVEMSLAKLELHLASHFMYNSIGYIRVNIWIYSVLVFLNWFIITKVIAEDFEASHEFIIPM